MASLTQQVGGAQRTTPMGVAPAVPIPHERVLLAPRWATAGVLALTDVVALGLTLVVFSATLDALSVAYPILALVCLGCTGAYRCRINFRSLDAMPWLATRFAIPLLALAPVVLVTGADATPLLGLATLMTVFVLLGRVASYSMIRSARERGRLKDRTVILGAGMVGSELAQAFLDYPEYGVNPVGFVDCVSGNLPCPVLGDMDELDQILGNFDIQRVVVAFGPARESELVGVLRTAVTHDVDVHVVPRFFDCGVAPEGPDIDDVRGIPLYRVHRAALRAPAWFLKRVVDIAIAGTVLLVAAPFLALVALAVKFSSPGPILFRQRRVGQEGREFEVPKFRTLRVNFESDTQWSVDDDPRLTHVGAILRRLSIDELPQLWSVLKGDMSLVGPRPERPFFVRRFSADIDGYSDRHRLPVGLTGWAQVHGLRGDTSIEERARYDNQYIEHWSLWRDFVVLVRTVREVLRGTQIDR